MSSKPDLANYVDVAERIAAFKEKYPEGSLQSEIINLTDSRVVIKAFAYRSADDARPATGHAAETIPGATPYTRGSEIMVCETSAWGRAIAALGFEVRRGTPIASRQEVEAAQARRAGEDATVAAAAASVFSDGSVLDTVVAPAKRQDAPAFVSNSNDASKCPRHQTDWVHKSGTAKATGKPYDFYACDAPKDADGFCRERPDKGWVDLQSIPF